MKYYVISDVHGFYTQMTAALTAAGFFADQGPHKLVVLGDLLDRGIETVAVQNFIADLLEKNMVILIRGNHEDLLEELATVDAGLSYRHHVDNGTYFSALELTGYDVRTAHDNCCKFADAIRDTIFYKKIMPAMVNYHESEHYIFVHGWIPFRHVKGDFSRIDDWRIAPLDKWKEARFENGMEAAAKKITEPGKTIVCGHWHASYGHAVLEGKGSEFGPDADFSPYYGEGVIAIDACTAYSGLMNCIVIED